MCYIEKIFTLSLAKSTLRHRKIFFPAPANPQRRTQHPFYFSKDRQMAILDSDAYGLSRVISFFEPIKVCAYAIIS